MKSQIAELKKTITEESKNAVLTHIQKKGLLIGNNWLINEETGDVLVFRYRVNSADFRYAMWGKKYVDLWSSFTLKSNYYFQQLIRSLTRKNIKYIWYFFLFLKLPSLCDKKKYFDNIWKLILFLTVHIIFEKSMELKGGKGIAFLIIISLISISFCENIVDVDQP